MILDFFFNFSFEHKIFLKKQKFMVYSDEFMELWLSVFLKIKISLSS